MLGVSVVGAFVATTGAAVGVIVGVDVTGAAEGADVVVWPRARLTMIADNIAL